MLACYFNSICRFNRSLPLLVASFVAQLVNNPPALQETWVQSLNSVLENSMDCIVQGVAKSWTLLSDLISFSFFFFTDTRERNTKCNKWMTPLSKLSAMQKILLWTFSHWFHPASHESLHHLILINFSWYT